MRRIIGLVLMGLAGFLITTALLALIYIPGAVKKTPLDTDTYTRLTGNASALPSGAGAPVKALSHTVADGQKSDGDVVAFERAEWDRLGLPAAVGTNHRLVHFQHLFSGSSYAAGYDVYLWAEVLDADSFDAFLEAGDPFDPETARRLRAFVYGAGDSLEDVPEGARVGTASLRRRAQLLATRPDLRMEELHGNVDTRLRKLEEGELDAIVLAAAGLRRLGREAEIGFAIPADRMVPAAGQGALALQVRTGDEATSDATTSMHGPANARVSGP